jgi:NTE family protein
VKASCAIPGLLRPVAVAPGRLVIDGGWVAKVPVAAARRLGAELVIAVDVSDELGDSADLTSGPGIVLRGDALSAHRLKRHQLALADAVLAVPLARFGWADFVLHREIVAAGREAARAALPALRERLRAESSALAGVRRSVLRLVAPPRTAGGPIAVRAGAS